MLEQVLPHFGWFLGLWPEPQNLLYTHTMDLLSGLKKEVNSDTCHNMDEPLEHCGK